MRKKALNSRGQYFSLQFNGNNNNNNNNNNVVVQNNNDPLVYHYQDSYDNYQNLQNDIISNYIFIFFFNNFLYLILKSNWR